MQYRMPDGSVTTSQEKYLNAWEDICVKLEKIIPPDYRINGFDPGIAIQGKGRNSFTMPVDFAIHLIQEQQGTQSSSGFAAVDMGGCVWTGEDDH